MIMTTGHNYRYLENWDPRKNGNDWARTQAHTALQKNTEIIQTLVFEANKKHQRTQKAVRWKYMQLLYQTALHL